jgi:hypothetical protein
MVYMCASKCAGEPPRLPKLKHVWTGLNGVRTRATEITNVWSCSDSALACLDKHGNKFTNSRPCPNGVVMPSGYTVLRSTISTAAYLKVSFWDFEIMFILRVKYREKTSKRIIRFSIDVLEVEQFKQFILLLFLILL